MSGSDTFHQKQSYKSVASSKGDHDQFRRCVREGGDSLPHPDDARTLSKAEDASTCTT